jgi:hypothetical protein
MDLRKIEEMTKMLVGLEEKIKETKKSLCLINKKYR